MKNGREYLIEYAKDKEAWLKELINNAIETNCDIPEDKINYILDAMLYDKKIDVTECSVKTSANSDVIRFKKLVHKQGVNALAKNQTIKFCDNVNILYGLNGSGKSSYFRILNEVVGGIQKKEIIANINIDKPDEIKVDIDYDINGIPKNIIDWDASTRSLNILNKCMVYDTSYQSGLLDVRESNETLVEPLGLHLFGYVIDKLNNMKIKVDTIIDDLLKQRPQICTEYFSEPIKSTFTFGTYNKDIRNEIEKKYEISDIEIESMKEIEDNIKSLKQINIKDKIKILADQVNSIESLIKLIDTIYTNTNAFINLVCELITKYKIKEKEVQLSQQRYQVLVNIPKSDTKEWKKFIDAGSEYNKIVDENNNGICPYCRQELKTENSIEIVKAYGQFLNDNAQVEFEEILNNISTVKRQVQTFIIDFKYQDNIIEILQTNIIGNDTICEKIDSISKFFNNIKESLVSYLDKFYFESIEIENVSELINELKNIQNYIINNIVDFSKEEELKNIKINELEAKFKFLNENKSISNQKSEIIKWFSKSDEIKRLELKKSSINSRALSTVSGRSHDELLTESLRVKFEEELKNIGLSNLEVELQGNGIRRGISSTKLIIKNSNDIKMILSEGEQRAIALSLFIAEIRLQNGINPIILDDPINSLDHKIAGRFAERLLELDNQMIIFTHNKLFLDSFESSNDNHVCKTIDTDCNTNRGKHIRIHEVISYDKNGKGVLRTYKGSKLKDKIREIEYILGKQPFEDDIEVANLMRLAVESAIDEVIFNNQVPTKYSNKNSRINWESLKQIKNDGNLVDKLKEIHNRVSGGSMHNGTERNENPIEFSEYKNMVEEIKKIADL